MRTAPRETCASRPAPEASLHTPAETSKSDACQWPQSDWLNAIRAGKEAGSPFSYGGALSEIGLLGMIAIQRTWGSKGGDRTGLRLDWDSEKMKFTNDDEANKLVNPPYRTSWKL